MKYTHLKKQGISLLIVSSFLGLVISCSTQKPASINPHEISQILIAELENGWNDGNGKKFANGFTDDADFVDVRGFYIKSKEAIAKQQQLIFDTSHKDSNVKYTIAQSRALNEQTIITHVKTVLNCPSGPLKGENSSSLLFVIVKQDTEWLIKTGQNTLILKKGKSLTQF